MVDTEIKSNVREVIRVKSMNRCPSGQEAIEFILISVLVFFGALFAVVAFGDKLSGFFESGSSIAKGIFKSSTAKVITSNNDS